MVILTLFAFIAVFGLIAAAVVPCCFFSLSFCVGSFNGCGGFGASVFVYPFGVGFSYVRWFRVCVLLFVRFIHRPLF